MEAFGRDCGYAGPPFRWDEERRGLLRAELDAAFFHLYLPADQHGHWLPAGNAVGNRESGVGNRNEGAGNSGSPTPYSRFPTPDSLLPTPPGETPEDLARLTQSFPTPRDAVAYILDTFPIVRRKDEAKHNGDYRTKRIILEIYDALLEAVRTGQPYTTRLDPPPADPRVAHPPRTQP